MRVYYAGCGANALSGPQNPQIQLIASLAGLISVVHQAMLPAFNPFSNFSTNSGTTWLAGP